MLPQSAQRPSAAASPREISMRHLCTFVSLGAALALGCPAAGNPPKPTTGPAQVSGDPDAEPVPGPAPVPAGKEPALTAKGPPAQLTPPDKVPPERRVWAYVDGVRRAMDLEEARAVGLTVVDLSDDWVPYIFWPATPGKDDHKDNEYLDNYVDLANDRIDVDGGTLRKGEHNYHEVYGIPPTLSVLRRRFLGDEEKPCFARLNYEVFKRYEGMLRPGEGKKKSGPKSEWARKAVEQLQQRLLCEGLLGRRPPKLKPGVMDHAVQEGVRRFERKNHIYGHGFVTEKTAQALARTPLENNHESLKRVLTERAVSASGVVEDGTGRASYRGADGKTHRTGDLVGAVGASIVKHLGLESPEAALAFMKAHTEENFERLLVAVPLPALPEYYADHMDLSVVIDRGDVWYDLPFDEKGRKLSQGRSKLPSFTLYTTYNGQQIPLVRWRTTIGSWQPEMRDGQEYYKYKISDVGPRVWKNIVAGPVWVPPPATPSSDLAKVRSVGSRMERVVAQSAFGPGYASAYGLAAAMHVTKTGADNQVRTHGSVNYMSIKAGFSHGCHRLYNYAAVRLFSFVLRHRRFDRRGQTKIGYSHRFEHKGEEFNINLHTRGYYYDMKPPVPVNVLEGRIKGKLQKPVEEYVKKPSTVYQEDLPSGKPKTPGKKPKEGTPSSMGQEQPI
ncbi:MAG: L,D-transpeptidase [Deltaproteobacteria bacterium]|nr:L,D-transpeptidase [Deltaproteobacteria bacterium]